jgi:hypothetical protein
MDKKQYDSDSLGGMLRQARRGNGWRRRSVLKSLGLAAAGAAFGGPLSLRGRMAQADTAGGTLVWGMPAETDILDPHATGGWLTYDVTYQMFEGFAKEDLTDPNVNYPKLQPALATSWDISDDGVQYTFKLREGVKFHDHELRRSGGEVQLRPLLERKVAGLFPEGEGLRRRLHEVDQGRRGPGTDGHQGHADPAEL